MYSSFNPLPYWGAATIKLRLIVLAAIVCLLALLPLIPAKSDLRTPGWFDPDGIAVGQDWHYRVPVTLPASNSVSSTAVVDVDFTALMTQLGITGTFDINSVRVVRPGGAIATVQEYTDRVFNRVTDAAGNNRGEVRWIVQDGGAQTYYIYFDIIQNGAKAANPQMPINANFERSATGQQSPVGWVGTRVNTVIDAQVRPNENVTITDGAPNVAVNTDGSPNSGDFSYLLGARSAAENTAGADRATIVRTITVPATNPGSITVRWKPEGWDSAANGSTMFDFIRIDIVGTTLSELVGPTAGNYATRPFSPNLGVIAQNTTAPGFGRYNNWDATSTGTRTAGMTVPIGGQPWWTYTQSLAPFAGQTVALRFRSQHATTFRTWFLIDDIEWSVVNGTLGTAEAFGVAGVTAADFTPGQRLSVSATVDARPTAATLPVTASVLNNSGVVVASGIVLFNDGTHGDAVAGDAIWTNDGSDPASPTYTIPLSTPSSSGWTLRVFARDASSSTLGAASNGLLRRNGLPTAQTEANFWNIDDSNFIITITTLTVTKLSFIVTDNVSGANPKAIPGATVQYCITITNNGAGMASNVVATDMIPANLLYSPGSIRSGGSCGTAATAEDDDAVGADENDPAGASIAGPVITIRQGSLAAGQSLATVFNAAIN